MQRRAAGGRGPAVLVELEARDGQCLALLVPYLPGPRLQDPVVQRSAPQVWT
ncbi:MAG: hypothetical protein M3P93_03075 [Actinomycetota bacterium]|nr:hypothetical protein [Actinomycetota bacterium]